jgi:hypothetical protein
MKTLTAFFLTLSVLSLLSASSLLAQEKSPTADAATQLDQSAALEPQAETAPTPAEGDNAPSVTNNEDFNPSVQISEDLSVSFPVDI